MNYISIIKYALIVVVVGFLFWAYDDWQYYRHDSKRQTENSRQKINVDSLALVVQELTDDELKRYLETENAELKEKLEQAGIKPKKIESVIHHNYYYRDTTSQVTDISPLIKSIKSDIPGEQSFTDSTKCEKTKGSVVFDGKKLQVKIYDREFKNVSDAVVYEERREWKLLWFKTRILGKRQFTSKTFDECGESKILKIEKAKNQ